MCNHHPTPYGILSLGHFLVILWVPLAHNRALPLFNLIFTKLIDNIIIYYIIMETITSYITSCSTKKKKKKIYITVYYSKFWPTTFHHIIFFINKTNKIYIYFPSYVPLYIFSILGTKHPCWKFIIFLLFFQHFSFLNFFNTLVTKYFVTESKV